MIPGVMRSFFFRLLKATNEGRLSWKVSSDTSFFCVQNGTTVTVSHHFDHDREVDSYNLYVVNSMGEDTGFGCNQYEVEDYESMRALFEAANACAFFPEKSLDGFFEGL